MTEQNQGSGNETAREFALQKIYVKDLSFETPNTPMIFREKWEPEISLQLGNTAANLGDGVHEVVLSVTVTAKVGDKTAYLAEVQQAGIFTIKGYAEQEMGPMVGVFCPNILFPYAREAISDVVVRGGFPQLLLAPVNFEALYQQHIQQSREKQQAEVTH